MSRLLITLLFVLAAAQPAVSETNVTDLSIQGSGKLYPIAVPQLCVQTGEARGGRTIPEAVARNLDLSGFFDGIMRRLWQDVGARCLYTDALRLFL